MKKPHSIPLVPALLALCFTLIWIQDTAWMASPMEALPVLAALPLFAWLGRPWTLTPPQEKRSVLPFTMAMALFFAGFMCNVALFPALGWTAMLWGALSPRLTDTGKKRTMRLLVLPVLAFPWLLLDGRPVGWWFRLTGAEATQWFFSVFNVTVVRQGTLLLVKSLPVDVTPACSGLNTLQAMLIAGVFLAFVELGETRLYWLCLPLLAAIAWLANTLRIIAITGIALIHGPKVAAGVFHTLGGWVILMAMFLLSLGLFRLMAQRPTTTMD